MADRVFVSNLCLHGFHGVHTAEKNLGQKFYIDIDCELAAKATRTDLMRDAVDYGALCDLAEKLSAETVFNLIETFAERIAQAVLDTQPLVARVSITVRKPSAPIRHFVDHVGVSIVRSRDD
ncbi:MAG: dihydroneopterin aldolase [Acidobacteria bacterium]|jgi:dihydroneopterin aldolase|nr:dihydroneopterin aldolase [Acidobacteriota bacterium]